jgi:hypothetical protein
MLPAWVFKAAQNWSQTVDHKAKIVFFNVEMKSAIVI